MNISSYWKQYQSFLNDEAEKNYMPTSLEFFNEKAFILNGSNHAKKCSINPDNGILNRCEEINFFNTKLENKIFDKIVFVTVNASL